MRKIEVGVALMALMEDLSECGDISLVQESEKECFLALIDVLGHGAEAHHVAQQAKEYLKEHHTENLSELIKELHLFLAGSRGAVVALCRFDLESGGLQYIGVGNITARIIGNKPVRLLAKDGIIGYGRIHPLIQQITLSVGDTLLLHSDGIKEHVEAFELAAILCENAGASAKIILNRFRKDTDDASCIVMKCL